MNGILVHQPHRQRLKRTRFEMFFCFRPKRQRGVAAREGPALIVPGLSIRHDGASPTTLHILRIPDYDIPECAILVLYRFVRSQRSPNYPPERAVTAVRERLRVVRHTRLAASALYDVSVRSLAGLAPASFLRFVASPQLPSPSALSIGVIHLA